jgi:hypothetical protein
MQFFLESGITFAPGMTRTSDLRFRKTGPIRVGARLSATHCWPILFVARGWVNQRLAGSSFFCFDLEQFVSNFLFFSHLLSDSARRLASGSGGLLNCVDLDMAYNIWPPARPIDLQIDQEFQIEN